MCLDYVFRNLRNFIAELESGEDKKQTEFKEPESFPLKKELLSTDTPNKEKWDLSTSILNVIGDLSGD